MTRYRLDLLKISEQLPSAFSALVNWYSLSHSMSNNECHQLLLGENRGLITNRRLYEFFDAHLICVNINGELRDNAIRFYYNVNNKGLIGDYSSRLECEVNAFTEAFEFINNEIINNEKGAA